jgi:hypothetical protein
MRDPIERLARLIGFSIAMADSNVEFERAYFAEELSPGGRRRPPRAGVQGTEGHDGAAPEGRTRGARRVLRDLAPERRHDSAAR